MQEFEPAGLLRALENHRVRFVVIGGVAGVAHGSPSITRDLDICYERSSENLEALARMLRQVHATLRGAPADLPFRLDALTLRMGDHFTFSTDLGDFDCIGSPAGTDGYEQLILNAVEIDMWGKRIRVAGLEDLIRMKRAVGRPKDRIDLEVLGALRDEINPEPG